MNYLLQSCKTQQLLNKALQQLRHLIHMAPTFNHTIVEFQALMLRDMRREITTHISSRTQKSTAYVNWAKFITTMGRQAYGIGFDTDLLTQDNTVSSWQSMAKHWTSPLTKYSQSG